MGWKASGETQLMKRQLMAEETKCIINSHITGRLIIKNQDAEIAILKGTSHPKEEKSKKIQK